MMVGYVLDEKFKNFCRKSTVKFLGTLDEICAKYEKSSIENRLFPVMDLEELKLHKANEETMETEDEEVSDYDLDDFFISDLEENSSEESDDDENHSISSTSLENNLIDKTDCFENLTKVREKLPADLQEHSYQLLECSIPLYKNSFNILNYEDVSVKKLKLLPSES